VGGGEGGRRSQRSVLITLYVTKFRKACIPKEDQYIVREDASNSHRFYKQVSFKKQSFLFELFFLWTYIQKGGEKDTFEHNHLNHKYVNANESKRVTFCMKFLCIMKRREITECFLDD
jgi:hypothetical protein